MRKLVAAAVLFAVAGAALLLTVFPILALFDDYQDNPDSFYVEWAAVTLLVAIGAAVGGALLLRDR